MLAKLHSGATIGLTATVVEVEVDVASSGLPSTTIVGLANKAVDEAKERQFHKTKAQEKKERMKYLRSRRWRK